MGDSFVVETQVRPLPRACSKTFQGPGVCVCVFICVHPKGPLPSKGSGLLWVLEPLVEPTVLDSPAKFTLKEVADIIPGPLILWPVAFERLAGFAVMN